MTTTKDMADTGGADFADSTDGYRVVQRVIMPAGGDLDVLPLYLDPDKKAKSEIHPDDVLSRFSVQVRPGQRLSFGSYFNAFPASYWRAHTIVTSIRLSVTTTGQGTMMVYRSNARGSVQRVDSFALLGTEAQTSVDLPLSTFGDGGWYWFDLVAGTDTLTLDKAMWAAPTQGARRGTTSMAVTTMNRPDYCLRTIQTVAMDADLRAVLDELIIVDQGTQKVRDEDGFDETQVEMGEQLRVIDQANLGGSGGFSRGMYEACTQHKSDYVVLLDDDINLEPEGIIRLATFADFTRKPTLVGGHMFDIHNRSVLHTFGEVIDPYQWQPSVPRPDHYLGHDFNRRGLRATPWLHQRCDVDYNGWWMTLIPCEVIRQLGLSLPIFIKWDDAEYGLRARKAGIPTVSLPGAAVWHVSWIDKDDLVGWQAYFHERNRLITALIHSEYPKGGAVLRTSEYIDLKHLVSMQYHTSKGRVEAQEDVLRGPGYLHDIIGTRLGDIRASAKDFTDAQVKKDLEEFPPVSARRATRLERSAKPSKVSLAVKAVKGVLRQALPVAEGAHDQPQIRVAHKDNRWWRVSQYDSALVSVADGTGASWYKRDPELFRKYLTRSAKNHVALLNRWDSLAEEYRRALPEITSFASWEKTFGLDKGK